VHCLNQVPIRGFDEKMKKIPDFAFEREYIYNFLMQLQNPGGLSMRA